MTKVKEFFKRLFTKKNAEFNFEYFMVMVTSKYNEDGCVPETYGGFVFGSMEEAVRHRLDVEQFNDSYDVIGIQKFTSTLPLTCAKLNYTRTEGHPNPTVTFYYKD